MRHQAGALIDDAVMRITLLHLADNDAANVHSGMDSAEPLRVQQQAMAMSTGDEPASHADIAMACWTTSVSEMAAAP